MSTSVLVILALLSILILSALLIIILLRLRRQWDHMPPEQR